MKINEHKLDTGLSFLIYSGGLASMLLADLFVSKNYDVKFISNWAFLKSAILILSTVCLLGYDILFVRDISLIKRYWKKFLFQTILISITSVFFISIFRGESFTYSVILFGAILSLSILNYISASSRALMNLWKAQLSLNFWKILMVIFLIFTMFDSPIFYYSISLILALLISIITKGDFGASKLV